MRQLSLAVFAASVATFATSSGGLAQSVAQSLARTGMVQEDIDIMVRAGSTLYASGDAQVGRDTIWQNPRTGAYGMAEVVEVTGDCVRVVYRFRTSQQPAAQAVAIRRCLVGNRWVLSG